MVGKIAVLIGLVTLLILSGCSQNNRNDFGLSGDIVDNFKVKKITTGLSSKTITGQSEDNIVKIREFSGINSNQSKQVIEERLFVINSAYRDYDSPYPGALSNQLKCSEDMKPNEEDGIVNLYATERLTFGACSEELIKYKATIRFLHCDNTLYQIELFSSLDSSEEELKGYLKEISCK